MSAWCRVLLPIVWSSKDGRVTYVSEVESQSGRHLQTRVSSTVRQFSCWRHDFLKRMNYVTKILRRVQLGSTLKKMTTLVRLKTRDKKFIKLAHHGTLGGTEWIFKKSKIWMPVKLLATLEERIYQISCGECIENVSIQKKDSKSIQRIIGMED